MSNKLYRKIVVLDSVIFFPEHLRRLGALADEVVEYNTCVTEDEVSERCRGADCIISCWVDIPNRVIEENPQLRTIAFWTHDFEHRIDAAFARSRGIHVPAIPDYGTDSVAELVLIALLNLYGETPGDAPPSESAVAELTDGVRRFSKNVKDCLYGRWLHEYIKTGQRRITEPDQIPEETLKGLTIGVLDPQVLDESFVRMMVGGFRTNVIYSLFDHEHRLEVAFRPVDQLLTESHALVYDSRTLPSAQLRTLRERSYLATVDVASLRGNRHSLQGLTLGIVGLGRIGSRVAQIAREGFGLDVQYYSRTPKPAMESQLGLRSAASLDELLTTSDIVSLHLPHHGAEDALTADAIRRIPDGTTVLNASVGNVIEDESLLLKRLGSGELRGYVDVFRTLPPRAELRAARESVRATYRLGWRTKSTVGLKTHKLLTKIANPPDLGC